MQILWAFKGQGTLAIYSVTPKTVTHKKGAISPLIIFASWQLLAVKEFFTHAV